MGGAAPEAEAGENAPASALSSLPLPPLKKLQAPLAPCPTVPALATFVTLSVQLKELLFPKRVERIGAQGDRKIILYPCVKCCFSGLFHFGAM